MLRKTINRIFKSYYKLRYQRIKRIMQAPEMLQERCFKKLVANASNTEFGKSYRFNLIKDKSTFSRNIPLHQYEDLKPYIDRMMLGERNVLWPGKVSYFSKSSGTTSSKSKYIPVTRTYLKNNHIMGSWDTMNIMYHNNPNSRMFECKSLIMGGALEKFEAYEKTIVGDVSAIMIDQMPSVGRPFYTPDFKTATMPNWDEKIERMAYILAEEEEMVCIGGVPTWTIVLFKRILEITGKSNMMEVWPNLQAYIHGGVSFTPYVDQFNAFLPSDQVNYLETYNASEGFFALQDTFGRDDMLLLLDNNIYYEFLPMSELNKANPQTLTLTEVEKGVNYALVISTSCGLWRYIPGDTICFTDTFPFRIKITGRTKQYINVFGEEVMVSNTDKALAMTCETSGAVASEYTAAPIYFNQHAKGGHQWLIEFEKLPANIEQFAVLLDKNLQSVNSDYEAKRYKDMALKRLEVQAIAKGSFHRWLKAKNKFGGQHKIPRLSNNRTYIEEIIRSLENETY